MKKLLYIGTAAIALGVGISSARAEDPVKLSLSGYLSQWWGVVGNDDRHALTDSGGSATQYATNPSAVLQHGDAALDFSGTAKLDNGLSVGANIQLDGSPANQENNSYGARGGANGNGAVEFSYATISGAFGTVNAGTKFSVEHDMHQDAPEEGWLFVQDGIWQGTYVLSPGKGYNGFIGGDWAGRTALYDELSTAQLQYITPTFMGFSAGFDYVPNFKTQYSDTGVGSTNPNEAAAAGYTGDSAGHAVLAYTNTFGDLSVSADADYGHEIVTIAAGGVTGAYKAPLDGYSGGLSLGYKGFTLGASILDRVAKSGKINAGVGGGLTGVPYKNMEGDGVTWDIGIGYENGPWGVAADYLQGAAKDRGTKTLAVSSVGVVTSTAGNFNYTDQENYYGLGAHYNLGPGIRESLNVFYITYKVTDGSPFDTNAGTGATLNTTINF
jgi:hypothetical protein